MAEIIIQVRNSPNPLGFQDGDIVHAHNDTFLLWDHTQKLASHRKEQGGFFKSKNSMAYQMLNVVSEFRFERVSRIEVKKVNLADSSEYLISGNLNEYGEAIDLPQFIARRKSGGVAPMFGREHNAVWFGGTTNVTLPKLHTLWNNVITPRTGKTYQQHKRRSHNNGTLKGYLVLEMEDFTNVRRGRLEEADIDSTDPENPITLARRRRQIDWRNMAGINGAMIDDVLNRQRRVDVDRNTVRREADIVRIKTR